MILWTTELETGSAKLDQQHRMLIDNINLLEDLLSSPCGGRREIELAALLVDYLEAYADFHFKGEELCMESARCPVHALNQQEHEQFRSFIQEYKSLSEAEGFNVELLQNLHRVMQAWIKGHILKIDTQLKACLLKQRGTS